MPSSTHRLVACVTSAFLATAMATSAGDSVAVAIDCCTIVKSLYRYMSVDDKFLPCTQGDTRCSTLRLVQLFMQHTSSMTSPLSPPFVRGSDIVFYVPTDVALAPLLVFSFFGRSVAPADENDMDMWLSYDTKLNKIRFEDSTCDFNRNVYTTLVLASLVLLMFFIAVQMVAENEKSSDKHDAIIPVASVADNKTAKGTDVSAQIFFKDPRATQRLRFPT